MLRSLLLISFIVFLCSSCQEEGCTNPFSENFDSSAEVEDGSCILWRNKFLGLYEVEEDCNAGQYGYTMGIVTGNFEENSVILNNFGDFGVNVNAEVEWDLLFVPDQTFIYGDVRLDIFNVRGRIAGNIVTIGYDFIQNGFRSSCVMECFLI